MYGLAGLRGRGEQTALLLASATVPGTFEPSLIPRSTLDQGIITGLATTLQYVLVVGGQDAVEAAATTLATRFPGASPATRQRDIAVMLDLALIPAGLLVQRALPRRPGEAVVRGLARQAGWRTTLTGTGGATVALVQAGTSWLDRRLGAGGWLAQLPVGVPVGLALAWAVEERRRRRLPDEPALEEGAAAPPVMGSLGAAAGVAAGVTVLALGEQLLAHTAGSLLADRLPGDARFWRLGGHALCLGGVVAAGAALYQRAMLRIEAGVTTMEPVLDNWGGSSLIAPSLSGSADSQVSWASLGREGRRHAFAYVRPRPAANRPPGTPDLSIETVMGEPAKATPIQVYVGLDSAPSAEERVELALAEMDRTGAWDRSLLMLVSPTGTGYVNYCAVAAVEYLTRGDVASVTLQYSKRPSPLSLGKVKDAREQNRLLWLRILRRLHGSESPPKVVLFGESLGAHTSQDVLMHWGTLGPQVLGIERALWIGTPYASKWMQQVTRGHRPDVDGDLLAVVNDFGQIEALPPERRAALRYVLVSHDNDGVTKFGADLIASRPAWLSGERPGVEIVPGASPRGVRSRLRWRPITTFLHTIVDMKNAQVPGAYRAWAHDYRPDLARFIREVYDLPASDEQLDRIERALEERETVRERLFVAQIPGGSVEPARA
jgi:uncharacterized membrane protein